MKEISYSGVQTNNYKPMLVQHQTFMNIVNPTGGAKGRYAVNKDGSADLSHYIIDSPREWDKALRIVNTAISFGINPYIRKVGPFVIEKKKEEPSEV